MAENSPKHMIAAAGLAAKALALTALALTYLAAAAEAKAKAVPQCGVQADGALCANGLCCSQFGFCGSSTAYCGLGCQSNCQGGAPVAAPAVKAGAQCGVQAGGAVCPNGLCCSQFGFCGLGAQYCGVGCQSQCSSGAPLAAAVKAGECGVQAGRAPCHPPNCCSQYGFCGQGPEYCGAGCQSQCPGP